MICEAKGMSHLSWYLFATNSHLITKYNLFFPLEVCEIKHEPGLHLLVYVHRFFSVSSPHSFISHSTFSSPIFRWFFFIDTEKTCLGD